MVVSYFLCNLIIACFKEKIQIAFFHEHVVRMKYTRLVLTIENIITFFSLVQLEISCLIIVSPAQGCPKMF